jgi:uncharacterized repeat protein (TIGR01451 family)
MRNFAMFNRFLSATAFVALVIAALLSAAPAFAAAGPLQVTSKVMVEQKTRAADGSVRVALVPARHAVPGDRVVFVLAYRNTGAQPIANIVFDNPVPAGIAYRGAAPDSLSPEVSVDGTHYGALASLTATAPTGERRAATPADVTHVRWRLASPIAAGAQGQLSFQAVLK